MKYCGKIGFANTYEKEVGVFVEGPPIERVYYGDILKDRRGFKPESEINTDVVVENQFSIVADKYAYEYFGKMKYLTHMGAKWKITSVEIQYPRLIISIGGMYHDQS